MTSLLEEALRRVEQLPQTEQDAIASQILETLEDKEAWQQRFAAKRDILCRLAEEAVAEDKRGETISLDEIG
jgi:hypothetical protein